MSSILVLSTHDLFVHLVSTESVSSSAGGVHIQRVIYVIRISFLAHQVELAFFPFFLPKDGC